MSSADITKLKKAVADMEARLASISEKVDDTCERLDKKYETFVEAMKSMTSVQTHAILDRVRCEMQVEFNKLQRDLQR